MTRIVLVAASIAWWTLWMSGEIFGPHIVNLALVIDDAARQSLRIAPDTDVPATMSYRAGGVGQTYAVMVHVKGQLGSARPVDDKPAFKIKLGKVNSSSASIT